MDHAVCITGLQRSYPEISHNIHYSLSNLYSGWRRSNGGLGTVHEGRRSADIAAFRLESAVGFFGVRPANDSWATVRTDLPPLLGESIQQPCGHGRPAWFSAYAKTQTQRAIFAFSFVQMMCDLNACHDLIQDYEHRESHRFVTVARLRLDLAWETPLSMPRELRANTIYTSRMNTKSGLNDKWAIGMRAAMTTYLTRVKLIPLANALHNRSARAIALKATSAKEGMLSYDCAPGSVNIPFSCPPRYFRTTLWQFKDQTVGLASRLKPEQTRRFILTSESFLMWALWRDNVSAAYEPSWMFCKFGNAVNTTARTCVPRMRKRTSCRSLICPGGLTDCGCKNNTCRPDPKKPVVWYCEPVGGRQLALDPYSSHGGAMY